MNEDWYFSDQAKAALLVSEGLSCKGTPFAERCCAKGSGFDCVSFDEHCFVAAGLERFDFPRDEVDYRPHAHNDKILEFLRGHRPDPQSVILAARWAELEEIEDVLPTPDWPNVYATGLMVGDLLVMRGKVGIWHLPVMIDSRQFIHCAWPGGVTQPTDIMPPNYRTAVKAIFRARALPLP